MVITNMRRILTSAFVISILSSAEATVSSLKEKLDAIDSLLLHFRNELEIPGLAVGIVADGQTVFAEGYGLRNLSDPNSHVTNRTLFAVGSLTKAFTTYALDCLVNKDGDLNWSDRVVDHIPEFHMKSEHTTNNIKVKDLVTHASGLPRHDMSWIYANFSIDEWLTRIPHLEPTFDLREKYQYNNIMYAVAGLVIERVTGQSWEKIVQDRIFKPLNMTRSYTTLSDWYRKRGDDNIAAPYSSPTFEDKPSLSSPWGWMDTSAIGPAASIISTAEDMTKWIEEQFRLTGPSMEMHIPQMAISVDLTGDAIFAYGLGWDLAFLKGKLVLSHTGRINGFTARLHLYPKQKVGIVILVNSDASMYNVNNDIVSRIGDIMTDTVSSEETGNREWVANEKLKKLKEDDSSNSTWEFKNKKNQRDVHEPQRYVGTFVNRGYGNVTIYTDNAKLIALFNDMRFVLESKGECDTFDAISPFPRESLLTFNFVRDATRDVSGVRIDMERTLSPILFEKRVDNDLYAEKYITTFVGSFQSTTRLLKVYLNEKKGLSIARDTCEYSGNLKPLKRNWFRWELSAHEFAVTENGHPLIEFNVTIDGVVIGLNKIDEGYVEMFKKVTD